MLLLCGTALSADRRMITTKEASELVYALLEPDGWTKLPGFTIVNPYTDANFPGFYIVHAEHYNPGGGSAIGHFAVERTTGEVMDWVMCGRFTSPSLTREQKVIRNRIGLTKQEYQRIKKPGPFCEVGEKEQVRKMGRPMVRTDRSSH